MNFKTSNRLGIVSLLLSVVVIGVVAVLSVNSLFQRDKEITTRLIFETLNIAVEKEFEYPMFVTRAMESDIFLRDFLEQEADMPLEEVSDKLGRYLKAICESNQWEGVYFSSATTLNYYSPQGFVEVLDPETDPYDQWYFDFVDSGKDYNLDIQFDQFNNDIMTVFIDKRMEDETGALLGVCTVGLRMDELQERIHQLEEKYSVSIYSTDARGNVRIGSERVASTRFHQDISPVIGGTTDLRTFKTGQAYIVYQYVPVLDWYLVVVNDQSIFTGVVSSQVYIAFGIVVLLLLLVLVVNLELSTWQKRSLANSAETDPLTKVFNRRGAEKRINRYLLSRDRLNQGGAVFLIDLDNFKHVNDNFGHARGDEVLVTAAQTLTSTFRNDDIVCRMGGDEFMVFCPGMTDRGTIARKAEQLLERGRQEIVDGEKRVKTGMSIGIAVFPEQGTTLEELSRNVDKALYAAKDGGKKGYRMYATSGNSATDD